MNKIEAIEKTIYNLENDVYGYNWFDADRCNCGVLAKTIMNGKNTLDAGYTSVLSSPFPAGFHGMFRESVATCSQTGIPLPEVFKALSDSGFNHEELKLLERCGMKKHEVIAYLKAWVQTLEQPAAPSHPDIRRSIALSQVEVREGVDVIGEPVALTERIR